MAADILLKIDGLDGESKIKGHIGEIDVLSYSWGASNHSSARFGGGSGTERGECSDVQITKRLDKASPEIFKKVMSGKHFDKATLVVRKATGDDPVEYWKMEMEKVYITGWNPNAGGGGEHGMESLSMSFEKVKVTYTGQGSDGKPADPVECGWNITAHEPA